MHVHKQYLQYRGTIFKLYARETSPHSHLLSINDRLKTWHLVYTKYVLKSHTFFDEINFSNHGLLNNNAGLIRRIFSQAYKVNLTECHLSVGF